MKQVYVVCESQYSRLHLIGPPDNRVEQNHMNSINSLHLIGPTPKFLLIVKNFLDGRARLSGVAISVT